MLDSAILVRIGAITLFGMIAVLLFARGLAERDLSRHIQQIVLGKGKAAAPRSARAVFLGLLRSIGRYVQHLSVFSAKDLAELERTARSAGYAPESAVPLVIGGKLVLMVTAPLLAYLITRGFSAPWPLMLTCAGLGAGMFGPNMIINYARQSRVKALRLGLSDALDLLVVCAEAGLGLESAIDRVATEMQESSPAIAFEFHTLGQDLRLSSDRGAALLRMGDRTGLESFQRLTMTLAQTLRYGTPLGQALRLLAVEMRNDRMLRLEEKAARLPTLLMIPLAMFILPCLFIVVAGPAGLRMMSLMSH